MNIAAIHISNSYFTFITIHYSNTLKRCYKWPPYIFAPVKKIKIAFTKFKFYERIQGFVETLQLISFKMTGGSCTDKVR